MRAGRGRGKSRLPVGTLGLRDVCLAADVALGILADVYDDARPTAGARLQLVGLAWGRGGAEGGGERGGERGVNHTIRADSM